jgi:type II secretory pathway pseudopilin PulG
MMRARGDRGETLVEVLFTIVIVSLTFSGLFLSLATAGNAGNVQRTSVQGDVVLRNYAEAAKAGAQSCVVGDKYTITYPAPLPAGFKIFVVPLVGPDVPETGALRDCPGSIVSGATVTSTQTLKLKVTGPSSFKATMDIRVRTP